MWTRRESSKQDKFLLVVREIRGQKRKLRQLRRAGKTKGRRVRETQRQGEVVSERESKKVAFMEWDSKMPPWELPELEQHAGEANLSSVVGSSGGGGWRHPGLFGGPDCSVDLKLGGWGDSGLAENWKEQRRASTAASSVVLSAAAAAASSSKRPRAPGNSSQNISCLVDDCKSDLSSCREYHRRHKVCELHSKTPIVMVGGQEQRFCQQCSRFHLLVEFDEVKRSCRKRLDGHNRRRRKPQPDTISTGNLFPTHHGSRLTSFPQNFQTAATDPTWTSAVKTEEEALYALLPSSMHFVDSMPKHFVSTYNQSYKEERQFSFLHDSSNRAHCSRAAVEPGAVCQPLLSSFSSAAQSSSNKIMFSDEIPPVLDSDCALSLLSSPTQASEINLGLMGQPMLSDLHYGGGGSRYSRHPAASSNSYSAMEEEHVMAQDASGTDVHCQSLFHVGDEGASDGASEPLPFSWQ